MNNTQTENEEKIVTQKPIEINKELLKKLKKDKIDVIELEVYSCNDYILKKSGINHTFEQIKKAVKLIKFYRMKVAFKMVVGLPESTKIDDINTAKKLLKFKPKKVSINLMLVEKGSDLEKKMQKDEYKPLALVQAIEVCKELVAMFTDKNIEVSSIDFEPKFDEEQSKFLEKIAEGPFHPAFRQLVESGLWYDAIVAKIKKLNTKVMQVEVTVNPVDTNNVIGYKQENISKLKELYEVDLIVTSDEKIKQGKSKIEITKFYKDFIEE